jgi:hypothetical protein
MPASLAALACLAASAHAQTDPAADARATLAPVVATVMLDYREADAGAVCLAPAIPASAFDGTRAQRETLFADRGRWATHPTLRELYESISHPDYAWMAPREADERSPHPLDADTARILNDAAGAFIRGEIPAPAPVPIRLEEGQHSGLPLCRSDRQLPVLQLAGPAISGDVAFVETGYTCGGLCGEGRLYALRRGPDGWRVVAVIRTWVS